MYKLHLYLHLYVISICISLYSIRRTGIHCKYVPCYHEVLHYLLYFTNMLWFVLKVTNKPNGLGQKWYCCIHVPILCEMAGHYNKISDSDSDSDSDSVFIYSPKCNYIVQWTLHVTFSGIRSYCFTVSSS